MRNGVCMYSFNMPAKVIFGNGSLKESGHHLMNYGKKAFIVSGKHVTKAGIVKELTDVLDFTGIGYELFNDITDEPTDEMISKGVDVYKKSGSDFIIAIGGGSPLDSGKAIAAMTVLEGDISEYMGKEINGSFPPMVMIPTTAGTGSECTKFSIITDLKKDIKMLLKGDSLLPNLAIIDPLLTVSSPEKITASTGIDALTHAVEAFTSRKANSQTDIYAKSAIQRIFTYLPNAYENGEDLKAREEMALAAFEAGVCINNASVTLVHGMSRPVGALFHVPHGVSNGMIIYEALKYAAVGCYPKLAELARIINVADETMEDEIAADLFLNEIKKLCIKCNIPTLLEYGIDKEKFIESIEKMAADAVKSGSPGNTIMDINEDDLIKIYHRLW